MPYPPIDGGAQVTCFTTLGLIANQADVTVLAVRPSRQPVIANHDQSNFPEASKYIKVDVNTDISVSGVIKNVFEKESYFTQRFHSDAFRSKLEELLKTSQFDIIQFEHVYMCIYIDTVRKYSKAKITLRPQNVENVIWERYGKGIKNPLKKVFISYSNKRLRKFEQLAAANVDAIIPLTTEDAAIFKNYSNTVPVEVVPMGYDTEKIRNYDINIQFSDVPKVYHLASMDWLPNEEAVDWFFTQVLPLIHPKHPGIKIHIAGRKMQERFTRMTSSNVIVEGEINDPLKWQEDKAIMIVPLLSGSGIRAKIIEGLALGKTIISTSVGAQGIRYTNGENILIADKPREFAEAIISCFLSRELCKKLGANAKKLSRELYETNSSIRLMLNVFQRILKS